MMAGNAHDYVQDPTIDPRPLMAGIARGMCYLHTHPLGPIVHGDLKGSNVLISDEGHALITDFGYTSLANSSFNMTVAAPKGGTIKWTSPEIIESFGAERECLMSIEGDTWAYGMTCLELFTRQVPFPNSKSWNSIVTRILAGPPERPSDNVTNFRMSDEWWNISSLCWARDPLLRPSMSELLRKVEETKAIADTTQLLAQLSQRANYFCVNLDDLVDREADIAPLRDSNAIIYRGVLRSMGTKITVKTVRAGLPVGDQQTVEEVLREVHLWSGLCHKNIAPLLGITTKFDHTITIVSKWTEPRNAQEYVQDGHIDPSHLLLGIAEGLSYLHKFKSGPLCHGDLRGLNVMVSEDGQALLIFGVAALINALFLPAAMSLRRPANWASPEELESGKFVKAPEADVWAFGMTALELFTRKPPFHCIESEEDVKARVLRDPPNRPSEEETCSRLTDGWWDICLPCWQRNPSSRPDMTEIASKIKLMICAVSVTLHPETGTTDNTSKSSIAEKSNPKKPPSDQANDKLEYPKQHPPLSKGDTPNLQSNEQSPQQRVGNNRVIDLRIKPTVRAHSTASPESGARTRNSAWSPPAIGDWAGSSLSWPSFTWNILGKSKTQSIREQDVVVFLVGPTGSGKSTFMGAFDRDRRTHGNIQSLNPSTRDVQAWTYKCEQIPHNIVLVDTPSFHTGHVFDAESIMRKWIQASRFSKCGRSGILYLHNLAGNPDERGLLIQEHLDTFAETFPRGCSVPGRVYVVPTMDRGLIPGSRIFQRHYPRLQTAMHSLHTKWNASMFRQNFRDEPEIAYNAVRNLMQDIAGV